MTLSKTDRDALKIIVAALPTITANDTLPHLRRIEKMGDGGNAELGHLLSAAQWSVGDIGQSEDNELEEDIQCALGAIGDVLDYRPPRDLKRRAAATGSKGIEFVTKPDGTIWCRL